MARVRHATLDDAPHLEVLGLYIAQLDNNPAESDTLVVEEDGEIVAWLQHHHRNRAVIEDMFSATERKGYGRMLVRMMKQQHNRLIAKNVLPRAADFWQKMGFRMHEQAGNPLPNGVWQRNTLVAE